MDNLNHLSLPRVKIAFCIDSFNVGGTELNALRTAEALDPERFELYIMHLHENGPLRTRYESLNVSMVCFPLRNLYSQHTFRQGLRFLSLLQNLEINVVHTHDIYTNIFFIPWARLYSKCAILASRRWSYGAPNSTLTFLNKWVYKLADQVLANSFEVANILNYLENVPPTKIDIIPNFLGEEAFIHVDEQTRIDQRRAWKIPDDAFIIGVVARLVPVKNHALLLMALKNLDSKFHLVLIGDGESRIELEQLVLQLNIEQRVHFTGEIISPTNLQQFFDISVLCSLSEGFPNAIIEALAAATPVVATPVGGVVDVIVDGVTGMLVPLFDSTALAEALKTLAASPLLRKRLGEAGRDLARDQFHKDSVIEKLSSRYEMLSIQSLSVEPRKQKDG